MPTEWTEKYRPKTLADVAANAKALADMKAWADSWEAGVPEKRALLLSGDPGIGKTSAAHALAHDMGWGVIELNASDSRNEEAIRRVAGAGSKHRGFGADGSFVKDTNAGRTLVILDEADNVFGREDRGGVKAIAETIRETAQPMILICNDQYELQRRGASLVNQCKVVKFSHVMKNAIPPVLRNILKAEGMTAEPEALINIAERSGGDLRSAINDLQALTAGKTELKAADVEAIGFRDARASIFDAVREIFKSEKIDSVRTVLFDLDETPDMLLLWLDENLPLEYKDPADLVEGLAWLSRADTFLGRTVRTGNYGLWQYAKETAAFGVTVAKRRRYPGFTPYRFPTYLKKMSTARAIRETRKSASRKVGEALHVGRRVARNDVFPFLRTLFTNVPTLGGKFVHDFDVEDHELALIMGSGVDSNEVKAVLEEAKKIKALPTAKGAPTPEPEPVEEPEPAEEAPPQEEEPEKPAPKRQKKLMEF
ncbi:MAG: replication factor C large subunit [Euryarchaeota archaeon]|nr:replication factor C large subunit [Euryarchaeota archaeon]